MSKAHELHLSDIHLRAEQNVLPSETNGAVTPCCSIFWYGISAPSHSSDSEDDAASNGIKLDVDGDLCPRRKRSRTQFLEAGQITIHHAAATTLNDVGLQVWRGALVLAEALMSPPLAQSLQHATVLELGSGCGFTSIVAALGGAKAVFCTDANQPSLFNAQHNATLNGVGEAGVLTHVKPTLPLSTSSSLWHVARSTCSST